MTGMDLLFSELSGWYNFDSVYNQTLKELDIFTQHVSTYALKEQNVKIQAQLVIKVAR